MDLVEAPYEDDKNHTGITLTTLAKDVATTDVLITVEDASSISAKTYWILERKRYM